VPGSWVAWSSRSGKAPRGPSTIAALRAKVVEHHQRFGDGVALVVVAHGGPPDDAARSAFKEMVAAVERSIAGVAVLVGIRGLRGKLVRGAVGAALRALRLPFEVKILESAAAIGGHVDRLLLGRGLDSPGAATIEGILRALDPTLST
jgi:hypothetical protein